MHLLSFRCFPYSLYSEHAPFDTASLLTMSLYQVLLDFEKGMMLCLLGLSTGVRIDLYLYSTYMCTTRPLCHSTGLILDIAAI
jgi:hypothetical protein